MVTGTSVAPMRLRFFLIAVNLHSAVISLFATRGAAECILSFDVIYCLLLLS
jgi:hypothetical protein